MKKLFLFLLMQGSLDGFTQDTTSIKTDTLRASLLLTRKKMTIAHNYEGHAVINAGRVVGFLDDRKKCFRKEVIVWDYRLYQFFNK